MGLEEILVARVGSLGSIYWHRSFGWMCAHAQKRKFFGGYKVIDDSVLHLLLRLSPKGFEEALETSYFEKFEFGKIWVVGEITSEEEIEEVWPDIKAAYDFVKSLA